MIWYKDIDHIFKIYARLMTINIFIQVLLMGTVISLIKRIILICVM